MHLALPEWLCFRLGYHWRWELILPTNPEGEGRFYYLVAGFWLTLEISLLSIVFGIILGLLIAFLGLSHFTCQVKILPAFYNS